MPRRRTWRVLRSLDDREPDGWLTIGCDHCQRTADIPTCGYGRVMAVIHNNAVIFDGRRDPGFLPLEIQCRHCRHIFELGERNRSPADGLCETV